MKRISITLVMACLLFGAKAQFTFGPKAGLNVSKIRFSSSNFKAGYRPNFYGGLFANYELNKSWAVQVEAVYSGEGGNEKATNNNSSGHISEGFIQVPVLAQYHTSSGFFAEAGPQVGFLLSIKETYGSTSATDIKQYYNKVFFRVPIGIGYAFSESSAVKGLGVNARYSFDFSAINKDVVGGQSLKNSVFSIGAYYKLPVKMKKK